MYIHYRYKLHIDTQPLIQYFTSRLHFVNDIQSPHPRKSNNALPKLNPLSLSNSKHPSTQHTSSPPAKTAESQQSHFPSNYAIDNTTFHRSNTVPKPYKSTHVLPSTPTSKTILPCGKSGASINPAKNKFLASL